MSVGLENLQRRLMAADHELRMRINDFRHPLDPLLNEMGRVLVEREKACQHLVRNLATVTTGGPLSADEIVSGIETGGFSVDQLKAIQRAALEAQYAVVTSYYGGTDGPGLKNDSVEKSAYPYTQVVVAAQRELDKKRR